MNTEKKYRRGEIYYISEGEISGSEQGGETWNHSKQ